MYKQPGLFGITNVTDYLESRWRAVSLEEHQPQIATKKLRKKINHSLNVHFCVLTECSLFSKLGAVMGFTNIITSAERGLHH